MEEQQNQNQNQNQNQKPKQVSGGGGGGGEGGGKLGGFGAAQRNRPKNDKEWAHRHKTEGRSMNSYLQRTLCVALSDGRLLVGRFVAFDKHMNIVLSGAHEYPKSSKAANVITGKEKQNRRDVGLVVLRGEHVINVTALKKTREGDGSGKDPKSVNAPTSASAVPGGALQKNAVPQLPKSSGARRTRADED